MSNFQAPSRRCVMCQYERPELELPCGCAIHGRCCPLWPIECCPWCAKPVEPDKRARVLPMVVAEPMFGEAMVGSCRRGRWDEHETEYMLGIVQAFDAGTLPVAKNANLVKFLCALLQCKLDRLHKKFKSGKRDGFRFANLASLSGELLSTAVMEHQASQRRLSKLEEAYALSLTPEARRSGLIAIQTAWREKLLAFCREMRVELDGAETALTPAIASGDGVFGDAHKRPRLDFGAGLAGPGGGDGVGGIGGAGAPDPGMPEAPPAIDDMADT